jgi:hypothetical protein
VREIRVAVFAPLDATTARRGTYRLAAYKRYNLAAGNGFVARTARSIRTYPAPVAAESAAANGSDDVELASVAPAARRG